MKNYLNNPNRRNVYFSKSGFGLLYLLNSLLLFIIKLLYAVINIEKFILY